MNHHNFLKLIFTFTDVQLTTDIFQNVKILFHRKIIIILLSKILL
jgi:hypothetical protein